MEKNQSWEKNFFNIIEAANVEHEAVFKKLVFGLFLKRWKIENSL